MTSETSDQRITTTPAVRQVITYARSSAATTTLVEDVMTTRVVSVTEATGYKDIVTLLRRHRVSAVPVLNAAGRVTGVVSEADLLMKQTAPALPVGAVRLAWRLRERSKASACTAAELMTSPAVTVRADADVAKAARLMRDRNVRRLPVTGADGRLVGIVSRTDVLSVYERPDEQIRDEITTGVIAGRFLLDPLDFDVTSTSGIVTMAGRVESSAVALSLLAAIRGVEGTVAVRDRLTYPPAARSAGRADSDAHGGAALSATVTRRPTARRRPRPVRR